MSPGPSVTRARRLWQVVEPVHAIVYFAEEPVEAANELGLKGFWMSYFAGRAAPMGAVGAPVVAATFYGFKPWMPERALPDAWRLADPATVLATRVAAIAAALRAHLGESLDAAVRSVGAVVRDAADAARADVAGRPLGAAWAAVDRTDDAAADLWLDTAVLREQRGDGHITACVAAGLDPLESNALLATTGLTNRDLVLRARGWSEEDWDAAVGRLQRRGLVGVDGELTAAGAGVRDAVEADTDRLAGAAIAVVGADGVAQIEAALAPLGRQLMDSGLLPTPNPIGLPRPEA